VIRNKPSMMRFALLLLTLCFFVAVTACTENHPRVTPEQLESKVEKRISKGGYIPVNTYTPAVTQETWTKNGAEIDIVYAAPAEKGRFPLLIYLPGLGENADAGGVWRTAWAKAGYAVLSLQARSFNATLWLSKESKSDRSVIARHKFDSASLQTRSEQLNWVLAEFRRRQQTEGSPFKSADSAHAGLAGFELGAQLVAGLSGESLLHQKLEPLTEGITPMTSLLISPPFDFAEGKPDHRFANMALPLLVVTASGDKDPNHITAQSAQKSFWQFAPPGDKFLLELNGGAHVLLAGNPPRQPGEDKDSNDDVSQESNPARASSQESGASSGGGHRHRGGGSMNLLNSGGDGSSRGGSQDAPGYGSGRRGGSGHGGNSSGQSSGKEGGVQIPDADAALMANATGNMRPSAPSADLVAAIRSVSIAFFDATLKQDPAARDWLMRNANVWLAKSGELQVK
jgi:hypothetical protein